MNTPGLASVLMYNNSASPVSLVCNPSHNITSPIDLSNNSLFLNNYGIPFLWTSSRNFCPRFDTILVIVNWLTKQAIFIPTHDTITSMDLAYLFVLHVFSKHRVPSHVISDRGLEFVSNFFQSLGTVLDMQLHFTLGYHPKGDGQTERTNQTLKQYLCVYCNYQQDNWSELLPLTEFAYNNTPSATTSVSPFFANIQRSPAPDFKVSDKVFVKAQFF